jgi:hypothetical protein
MRLKLNDGTYTVIDAWYHPECEVGPNLDKTIRKAGLWTTDVVVLSHLAKVNKFRKANYIEERDISETNKALQLIECAEAPLEIYTLCGMKEPWRGTGTLIREIPYGRIL